jgi:hypothetical protein
VECSVGSDAARMPAGWRGPTRRRLIRDRGAEAYREARQREHEASSDAMVKHWRCVVLAIANKTGKRVGVDTATRMLGRDDTD